MCLNSWEGGFSLLNKILLLYHIQCVASFDFSFPEGLGWMLLCLSSPMLF